MASHVPGFSSPWGTARVSSLAWTNILTLFIH
jgi:hypothetical protein